MKTLRSKIFIFVSLLLILPALPLSYFTMQLLDKSYGIGVNNRVESALDSALKLSAGYYRLQKERLNSHVEKLVNEANYPAKQITEKLEKDFPGIDLKFDLLHNWQTTPQIIKPALIGKFLEENKKMIIMRFLSDPNLKL